MRRKLFSPLNLVRAVLWAAMIGGLLAPAVSLAAGPAGSLYPEQRAALVALYNATNGPGWSNNTGWLTDPNSCNWYGVGCNSEGDTVLASPCPITASAGRSLRR